MQKEKTKKKKYAYRYGLKVRIYPSNQQKEIIRRNSDVSHFVYKEMVAVNKEISRLFSLLLK